MSSGLYAHTTRATGTVLTASIYNSDHQNHITNANPTMHGGYSDSLTQHQLNTDPGGLGTEVLAGNLAVELEQIRFSLKRITGKTQWYVAPVTNLETLGASGLADDVVTNAKLANMAPWKMKMRNDTVAGDPQDQGRPDIVTATPAGTHSLLGFLDTDQIRLFRIDALLAQATGVPGIPQGRLTIQTNTPVMSTSQVGQSIVRYTPYTGRYVPLYNGSIIAMADIGGEISQLTADTSKSPAACVPNSNYDVFIWDDAGTKRATRGPAWSSATSRGAGAGTTELVRVNGLLLNANNITNGPAAQRGTYVGSVRANSGGFIDWIYAGFGTGGVAGVFGVWNAYHRVSVSTFAQDATDSWTYETANWRSANAADAMRVSYILGLAEDGVNSEFRTHSSSDALGTAAPRACGIGYDSTNALAAGCSPGYEDAGAISSGTTTTISFIKQHAAQLAKPVDLGFHFMQAIEIANPVGSGTITWYGDGGAPTIPMQNGLFFSGRF